MEIPEKLKNLYRHWDYHTSFKPMPDLRIQSLAKTDLLKDICWFVNERIEIWKKKTSGKPSPFTTDPILAKYRFCNIFREFDRQTIEFHELLNPLRGNFMLWLMNIFLCRMIARPETIRIVGLFSGNEKEDETFFRRLCESPRPRFGSAYIFPISTIQKSKTPTRELFLAEHLPKVIGAVAKEIKSWKKKSVYDGVQAVLPIFGFNHSFLWTEVLIDTAYQFPEYIDLYARFPIGPGSMPTMRSIDFATDPSVLVQELCSVKMDLSLTFKGKPLQLSSENWEGIGCEYRKYKNLKAGGGRKRIYVTLAN